MPKLHFKSRVVKRVLLNLNTHKASGPDGIPANVLKKCASSLYLPLCKLFHLSYSTASYPSQWKVANVQPIPKKGETSNPANYRPIAICSILAKIMENIVNHHLVRYLEANHLISDRQYGFRHARSTGDMLAVITERLNDSIHRLGESKAVALDISKAFDRVWHEALLVKIRALGAGDTFVSWVSSFLANRSIRVVVDGISSNPHTLQAGVPQGSVLSPTLFLIFINDLLRLTENPIYSFADDSTLIHSFFFKKRPNSREIETKRREMHISLNNDLARIYNWGRANRVDFNASKTQCCYLTHKVKEPSVNLTLDSVNISESESLELLGIAINSDMRWNAHIIKIAKEASKCLGFLKRCTKYFTPSDLRDIYVSYIRPKMEYNCHIWAGASKTTLDYLDRVQNRAIKLINNAEVANTLDSLEHRRNVACITLFYRYFHGRCSLEVSELLPKIKTFGRNSRASNRAHAFHVCEIYERTTQYRANSFFARTLRMWNALPANTFPEIYDIQRFKTNVHRFLSCSSSSSSFYRNMQ